MDTINKVIKPSVYIIDEHPIVRDSLATLISSRLGMRVVGNPENNLDLLVEIVKEKPGLIILDVNMSTMKVISSIKRECKNTKILVYSGSNEGFIHVGFPRWGLMVSFPGNTHLRYC